MDGEAAARFRRADSIFDAALDLPVEERAAYVARACGDDEALRAAVERLLRASESSGGFLATPAAELAAPFLDPAALPPAGARAPQRVGPFRVVGEIGRGGMGAVYLGERDDGQFRQRVALKLVRSDAASDLLLPRFLRERQILASLEHPHIARLLDGGVTADGVPWFAMEYVEGEPIDRYCAQRAASLEERLALFRQVCAAVEYAHGQHVVHRDLKPSNVLVTADGGVKLLDFGIAKLLDAGVDDDAPATRTSFQAMTPEYAAPEQLRGEPVTSATDVYALGVLLYELLVGERPYALHGRSPAEVERVVCTTEPPRPSTAVRRAGSVPGDRSWRRLRGDPDTIVLKALQKQPERRYPSAAALAEDLRRLAEGRPVLARPDSLAYRTRRRLRRHAVALAALTAVAVAAAALSAAYASRSERGDARAGAAPVRAERILVADFTSALDDSVLVRAVAEAVRIDLAQFPAVRVLSPQQVAVTLQHMQRPGELAVNDSLAGELAAREGVAAIVTGEVEWIAGRYVVSARITGAIDGELLSAARESVDSTRLMEAVGRLTRKLRRELGEDARSLRSSPALPRVTTASLPALRAYSEALRHNEQLGDRQEAIRLLETAVAIDSGFASAHRLLGSLYRAGAEHARATAAAERAFRHRERLPVRERYLAMGSHHLNVTRDYPQAIAAYRAQLAREPDDVAALNNLSLVYRELRDFASQEQLLRRLIAVDTTYPQVYLALAEALAHQGRPEHARTVLAETDRRFPDHPITPMTWAYISAARQDWEEAERHIRRRLENGRARSRPLEVLDAQQTLGQILMTTGRVREAEQELRGALDLAGREAAPRRLLFSAVQLGWLELRYRRDPQRARAIVDSALALQPLERLSSGDRPYAELSGLLAALGDGAGVRRVLDVAERDPDARADLEGAAGHMMRGFVALLGGRHADAAESFRNRQEGDRCTICALPMLGEAYERMGQTKLAAETYARYLQTPWIWRFETDAPYLGWTLQRLAALYRQEGRHADAAATTERLRQLRAGADPEVAP